MKRIPTSKLTAPSRLLLDIRRHFIEAGGSSDAFDFAVADYAKKRSRFERSFAALQEYGYPELPEHAVGSGE